MTPTKANWPDKPVFISGFMASGKTTLGRTLAQKLDIPFQDLDAVIEKREGCSINKIFNTEGENYFRQKEREYLQERLRNGSGVLSLGGGALQDQQLTDHVKNNGILIFVDTPLETIVERVRNSTERPILYDENGEIKSKEALFKELKALYLGREKFYMQASVRIYTPSYPSVEAMADDTIEKIKQYG